MMEGRQHNNLWAEKLSQASLPDSGDAWVAMEALLDKKMPTGRRRDRRRWLLLILLLLLLIGVCNCPGRGRFSAVTAWWRSPKAFQTVPAGDKVARGPSPEGIGAPAPGVTSESGGTRAPGGTLTPGVTPASGGTNSTAGNPLPAAGGSGATPTTTSGTSTTVAGGTQASAKGGVPANTNSKTPAPTIGGSRYSATSGKRKHRRLHPGLKGTTAGGAPGSPETGYPDSDPTTTGSTIEGSTAAGSPAKRASIPAARPPDSSAVTAVIAPKKKDSVAKKKDSLSTPARKPVAKDSTHKKPPAPPKEEPEKKRDGGFMVGIGLNQFFTVGGQQGSSWNSGGITGTLSDYIPVPMIRYYFNHHLYIQLEGQINTPQYTKKNLVVTSTAKDSTGPTTSTQSSVSINKLFYFNLPLSLHYNVFDHLDLGAGLQFSRLTNGIGIFNDNYYTGTADSLAVQTKSFKGDSVYQEIKTHEFRFLLDASYTYKRFILGLRYNQALSKFINVRLSTGEVTQARNSSLQLYLRYILWNNLKKPPVQTK